MSDSLHQIRTGIYYSDIIDELKGVKLKQFSRTPDGDRIGVCMDVSDKLYEENGLVFDSGLSTAIQKLFETIWIPHHLDLKTELNQIKEEFNQKLDLNLDDFVTELISSLKSVGVKSKYLSSFSDVYKTQYSFDKQKAVEMEVWKFDPKTDLSFISGYMIKLYSHLKERPNPKEFNVMKTVSDKLSELGDLQTFVYFIPIERTKDQKQLLSVKVSEKRFPRKKYDVKVYSDFNPYTVDAPFAYAEFDEYLSRSTFSEGRDGNVRMKSILLIDKHEVEKQ
ncbi:MAG: hypothetical protein GOU99_02740 [Candidatus Altiarchaeota archaeon]|nr:hypothetical protein [Candidatus Altiarchaeota archaeon]